MAESGIQIGSGRVYTYDPEKEDGDIAYKKAERNSLLAESDVYVLEDFPTSKKTEWKAYRKALRDMDFSDLDKITFPTKPE